MNTPEAIVTARDRIDRATPACGRTDSVHLGLAVKARTFEECRAAAAALREVGPPILPDHNRVREAHATTGVTREVSGACIHLTGLLQFNKINHALACVDVIESLDSPVLASKIDTRMTGILPASVEVNISGEVTKHGYAPADVSALVDIIGASTHLQLAGSMAVGLNSLVEVNVHAAYAQLRGTKDEAAAYLGINESGLMLPMGMNRDLERAIAGGTTTARLGAAIFGARHI